MFGCHGTRDCQARYIHINGREFLGHNFSKLTRTQTGIESKLTTTTVKIQCKMASLKQAINKTISDKLQVVLNVNPPTNKNEAIMMVSNALSAFIHVMRCSVNHAMDTSLGVAVFAEIYRILIRYNLIGQSYELNSI